MILGVALFMIGMGGLLAIFSPRAGMTFSVSPEAVQAVIDKHIPMQGEKIGIGWTVHDVSFEFLKGDRVRVVPNLQLQAGRFVAHTMPSVIGMVSYDAGGVYVKDFVVEEFNPTADREGTPSLTMAILARAVPASWEMRSREAIAAAVQKIFAATPLYQLPDAGINWWTRRTVSKIAIDQDQLLVTVTPFAPLVHDSIIAIVLVLMTVGAALFAVGLLRYDRYRDCQHR